MKLNDNKTVTNQNESFPLDTSDEFEIIDIRARTDAERKLGCVSANSISSEGQDSLLNDENDDEKSNKYKSL